MKKFWIRTAALCAAVGMGSAALAEEPAKLHAGLRSANGLLADMEYLVVKTAQDPATQAKQKATFEKDIKPNIEIFLIGVNPDLPVGSSFLLTAETGKRRLLQIPVDILVADFIDGNLGPIGIDTKKDRTDKTLYKLSGDTLKNDSWMRAKGNNSYASISEDKNDIPVGVVTPDVTLNAMFAKGYDFALSSLNSAAEAQTRAAAFQKLKENQLAALAKKKDETQETFDLRKLALTQQVDNLGQLISNTLLLDVGLSIDEAKQQGLGQLHWTALPDTELAKWIAQLEGEKSRFASLSGSDNSVLTARVLLPISQRGQADQKEVYKLSPTVLRQKIEANKELNDEVKAARIGVTAAGIEVLDKSVEKGVIDLFLDIAPSGDKLHSFVLGIGSTDVRAEVETLVGHMGKVHAGWSSQVNIETVGETKFHSFTASSSPQALKDFFGADGTVYVAAGPDFVGMAFGAGSLDVLKKLVEQATTGEKKNLESFVDVRFHARESLEITHTFRKENNFKFFSPKPDDEPQDKGKTKKSASRSGKNDAMSTLQNFDWQKTAIDTMRGTDDLVTIQMKLVNGALEGEIILREGVLTAMGAVIAKFAEENLSGK
jgi:hypothetical protein